MSLRKRRSGPDHHTQAAEEMLSPDFNLTQIIVAESDAIHELCKAFVVLVLTPQGKYRRRVYLSLHSAQKALRRTVEAGQPARMVLCRLTPDEPVRVDGRWSE